MNRIRYVLTYILVWIIFPFCSGQNNDLLFHHLGVKDGLSQTTNWFIFKDSRGFVWISSIAGLNRFDGTHVRLFTPDISDPSTLLGENIQSNFYEDQEGNIWFSTSDAINKYNWDHDCFDHYQLTDSSGIAEIGYYIFYLDSFQNIWFLQDGVDLYTYNIPLGRFTFIDSLPPYSPRCDVVVDGDGHVKKLLMRGAGTDNIKVLDIQPDYTFGKESHLPETPGQTIMNIDGSAIEGDTVIWILSTSHLIRHSWLTGEEKMLEVKEGRDVVRLNDTILMIATTYDGLLQFNTRTWQITHKQIKKPDQPESLLSNNVRYVTKDNDDNIWVSTNGIGVSYSNLHKKKFESFDFKDIYQKGLEITPEHVYEDSPGRLLCFTKGDGVLYINCLKNNFIVEPFEVINSKLESDITIVAKDAHGNYWIGTSTGIYIYMPRLGKMILATDILYPVSMQPLPDGSVLITSRSIATLFRGKISLDGQFSFSKVHIREHEGFPVFLDGKGRVWLNEKYQGFTILDSVQFKTISFVPVNGICSAMVSSYDGNTIWIASNTGLFEIDASKLEIRKVHSLKTGFPATGISSMIMDHDGLLWLGHYNGIISFNPVTGQTRPYTQPDGLPSLEFTKAACELSSGEFWFGNTGGFARFYPDSINEVKVMAIPQITELMINDKPSTNLKCEITGVTNITEIKKLTFDYKHNTLSFVVNALEFSAPEYNKVQYALQGLDKGFITAPNGSTVRYPNLPQGNYHFILYAINSDGVRNPEPRIIEISINPPFYKTWWFMIAVGLVCISIIAYIIYLRFSKALELQKVRLKLYENLHDDVGSRLTAIVLSAEDLERNENLHHPKLHAISQIARSIVGNMRRLVWAIDPENDSMQSLMQKITHDKSTILDDAIVFSFDMDPGLKNTIVPGEVRYQISSICNEAFTNITKYAKAKKVSVRITKESGWLKLLIKDDGIGFTPAEKTKNALTGSGYGLANMQRRASRVGGTFTLHSTPGEGATIEAKFPLS